MIDRRWIVVVAALATLGSCVPLVKKVPKGFLPKNDEAQFEISVRTPEGTSLAATQIAAERIAREVREWPEVIDHPAHDRRQPAEDAQPGADLRAPACRPTSARSRRISCRTGSAREIVPKLPKDYRVSASAGARPSAAGTFSTATVQYT